jgi:hypothetical protein
VHTPNNGDPVFALGIVGSRFYDPSLDGDIVSLDVYDDNGGVVAHLSHPSAVGEEETTSNDDVPYLTKSKQPPTFLDVAGHCFSCLTIPDGVTQFFMEIILLLLQHPRGRGTTHNRDIADLRFVHEWMNKHFSKQPVPDHLKNKPTPIRKVSSNPELRCDPCSDLRKTDSVSYFELCDRCCWVYRDLIQRYGGSIMDDKLTPLDNRSLFWLIEFVVNHGTLSDMLTQTDTTQFYVIVLEPQSKSFWYGHDHDIDPQRLAITEILRVSVTKPIGHVIYTSAAAIKLQLDIINGVSTDNILLITDRSYFGCSSLNEDNVQYDDSSKMFTYPYWCGASIQTRVTRFDEQVDGDHLIPTTVRTPQKDKARAVNDLIRAHHANNGDQNSMTLGDIVTVVGKLPLAPAELAQFQSARFHGRCLSSLALGALAALVEDMVVWLGFQSAVPVKTTCWWIEIANNVGLPFARAMMGSAALRLYVLPSVYNKLTVLGEFDVSLL